MAIREHGQFRFGIPYQGSKNAIADKLIRCLPSADTFVDMFCGGCSMTHAAIMSGKFRNIVCNDVDGSMVELVQELFDGMHLDDFRWVSHEDFNVLKHTDKYVALLWSYGNNQREYLFSRESEPYKKAMHHAIFLHDYSLMDEYGFDLRCIDIYKAPYLRFTAFLQYFDGLARRVKNGIGTFNGLTQKQIENFMRHQWYDKVLSLQHFASLRTTGFTKPTFYSLDYSAVPVEGDCVVYCDPPYRGTKGYKCDFDMDRFDEWCLSQVVPVFISEYTMPEQFVSICEVDRSTNGIFRKDILEMPTEKLFIPKKDFLDYSKECIF